MKRFSVLFVVMVLVASVSVAFAGIADTRHNLVNGVDVQTTDGTATLCGFCHIPHGGVRVADGDNQTIPIWARSNVRSTYTLYQTGGTTVIGGNTYGKTLAGSTVFQPGVNSLTCLSCHDGQIGLNVTYKNGIQRDYTGMTGTNLDGASKLDPTNFPGAEGYNPVIGTDLRDDHPVGIDFVDNAVIPGLGTAAAAKTAGARIYNYVGRSQSVECGSCHDPHTSVRDKFTRIAPASLCQACHSNK